MRSSESTPDLTLVDVLRRQAENRWGKVGYSFSYNGDDEGFSQLTYGELDTRARAIAMSLQRQGAAGQAVVLLCRPGLDHIAGFFGCLYAGAVAVPVHERLAPRLTSVIPDAEAEFVLATARTQAKVKAAVDSLSYGPSLRWCAMDDGVDAADDWVAPDIDTQTAAMLQYTSGSTNAPKGVVLNHGNLLHNVTVIREAWGGDENDRALYWLPQHHDMGLIGAILTPLHAGCTSMLMSPTAFIKRPVLWLEALSRRRATCTTAPNFAFDRCVETTTAKERAALDLSNLTVVMNGAEPVRAATLQAFADAFAPAGFRPEAMTPVYGLAEATLIVSGGSDSPLPQIQHIDRTALQQDRVVNVDAAHPTAAALVGCGRPRQRIVIADPESRRECEGDQVGEIWVSGPSVAQGYWGRPAETEQTFAAYVSDTGDGPFLRTGDLGFLRGGELFVTGRCKDLIVIGADNYYPNDIEHTVQQTHPVLLSARGAAFTVEPKPEAAAQLIVVQEADRSQLGDADIADVMMAARNAVLHCHGVDVGSLILVDPMRIPTTSSGKIQRGQCRQQFIDGHFETVAELHMPPTVHAAARASEQMAKQAALIRLALVARGQQSS